MNIVRFSSFWRTYWEYIPLFPNSTCSNVCWKALCKVHFIAPFFLAKLAKRHDLNGSLTPHCWPYNDQWGTIYHQALKFVNFCIKVIIIKIEPINIELEIEKRDSLSKCGVSKLVTLHSVHSVVNDIICGQISWKLCKFASSVSCIFNFCHNFAMN